MLSRDSQQFRISRIPFLDFAYEAIPQRLYPEVDRLAVADGGIYTLDKEPSLVHTGKRLLFAPSDLIKF